MQELFTHSLIIRPLSYYVLDNCLFSACPLAGPGTEPGYTEKRKMNQLLLGAWAEESEVR